VNAVVAAVGVPVFVGSGITPDNIATFAAADGLIVGSSVKQQSDWRLPLDATATKRLADAFQAAHSQR
jgi:predicted TIM-barrel enzyme